MDGTVINDLKRMLFEQYARLVKYDSLVLRRSLWHV